ncbi:xin actin-binding repeat-containing protein 2 [Caerostris extrusa]|uniref:Xin actin-binding repeat-containing protein 2 n=1 Tax=Caerostris extrusa TaxID=172846 RepID=A0AAV4Y8V7_CAEEX|nr:xin actin-binding repeat-containing protein 2 [Caerostris extrusa]
MSFRKLHLYLQSPLVWCRNRQLPILTCVAFVPKKVYPMEKLETSGMRIHKNCFRCAHCSCMLRLENYTKSGKNLYCTPHFKQLFISRGNYDEGFGREQHKDKWNRSSNNTPVPRDLPESDDVELSNGLEQAA